MTLKKITQNSLFIISALILYFSYYYLPSKNRGVIEIKEKTLTETIEQKNDPKNTFFDTEYKSQNNNGQIFTTRAKESYIYQKDPGLIYLLDPYSFTILKKDQTLIEINSKEGFFDKSKKITNYKNNVIIKNKSYLITANEAKHIFSENIIIINGNVTMKDLTQELSHEIYCDTLEINTINNNAVAYMQLNEKKVIAKKYK